LEERGRRIGSVLAWIALALAVGALASWPVGVVEWTSILPDRPEVVPNTALALAMAALSVLLRAPRSARGRRARVLLASVCALLVIADGVITLVEYALDLEHGIDLLLLPGQEAAVPPGRASPLVAAALTLFGAALLGFDARAPRGLTRRPAELLALAAAFIMIVALTGHLFGTHFFYRVGSGVVKGVSITTAVTILLLVASMVLQPPDVGLVRHFLGNDPAAALLRRLAIFSMLVPLGFGLIVNLVDRYLDLELPLTLSLLAVSMIPAGLALAWNTTRTIGRLHASVAEGRTRTQALFDHAPEGIFIADLEGRFTEVNRAGAALLGYSPEELLGKSIVDIIPPANVARLWQGRDEQLRGEVERGEWTLLHRDGSEIPVEGNAKILADRRWQAFVRDIRARKRAEEALRRAEVRQRLLAEAGAALASSLDYKETLTTASQLIVRECADLCVVHVLERAPDQHRVRVVTADPSKEALCAELERLCASTPPSPLLQSVLDSGRPLLLSHVQAEHLEQIAQRPDQQQTLRQIDPRSVIVVPLLARGMRLGLLGLVSTTPARIYDSDDVRLAEGLAERVAVAIDNARLYRDSIQATQDRDELLGVVAHDLRNPLSTIMMQAKLARRHGPGPERRSSARSAAIERAVTRMNRLIQDILDVTKMEAGHLPIEQRNVAAAEMLSECVQSQASLAAASSIELRLELPAALPEVWADRDRLQQVLENLIGNALKFTPAAGHITVGAAVREREVLCWVADSGQGMDPEDLPHAFDRFWQAHRAGRSGAGLGLAIVKGLVEAHGGRVWVESKVGVGATFYFTLPLAEGDPAHAPPPANTLRA
jgi:PAS domain S-box-containing protein